MRWREIPAGGEPQIKNRIHSAIWPLLAATGPLLVACASQPSPSPRAMSGPRANAVVFATPGVQRFATSNQEKAYHERFEYSRRNAGLNVVRRVPLTASRQWPQPPRPAERPVRFRRWEQDR